MQRRLFLAFALGFSGCVEFSPFETDLDDDQRDKTAENLARLARRADPGPEIKFAFLSDSHQGYDELSQIVDRLNQRGDLEFVVHAGDLTDLGLRREYIWALDELERLNVPYFTVVGNHDSLSNGKEIYASMFGPEDYAFDHGSLRMVCFNANELEYEGVPRLGWLESQLRPASGNHVVAVAHQPPQVIAGNYAGILTANSVLVSLSGHVHTLEFRRDAGTVFFSVGAALHGEYAIVAFSSGSLAIESCTLDACLPVAVPP